MSRLVLDIEADGLLMDATKVWCIVIDDIDTGKIHAFGPSEIPHAIQLISNATELIGHNISLYDLPLLSRLHGLTWENLTISDTMLWSRLLDPDIKGGHSLKVWGERLGCFKQEFHDFTEFSSEMLEYCKQDVEVTTKLYHHLSPQIQKYLDAYETEIRFAYIISQQILNGFTLDVEFAEKLCLELEMEYGELYDGLSRKMPRQRINSHRDSCEQAGRLISEDDTVYRYITEKTEVIKTKTFSYTDPNPRSRQQIVAYLKTKYQWDPTKYTEKGNPVIDEKLLDTLPYPEAKEFSRLFTLNKQISMIKGDSGWLTKVKPNGRIHGSVITCGAATGRCTHANPNMAQITGKKKEPRMRQCWVPKEGWKLVSCDADQLEARCLAHFTTPYDYGDLTQTILQGDFHDRNQTACGFLDRNTAKTAIYALIYGAGDHKLGIISASESPQRSFSKGVIYSMGKQVRAGLKSSIMGLEDLEKHITMALSSRPYLYGLDGRPLHVRSRHAALNTLLQSAGAVIMKWALIEFWDRCKGVGYVHGRDFGLCANVHDEVVLECDGRYAEELCRLFNDSMDAVAKRFRFKCPLEAGGQIGNNWAEIHG